MCYCGRTPAWLRGVLHSYSLLYEGSILPHFSPLEVYTPDTENRGPYAMMNGQTPEPEPLYGDCVRMLSL